MRTALQQLAPGDGSLAASAFVERLGLWEDPGRGGRPRVVAAMIASADGRATVAGRAGGLGSPADRAVLRELRTAAGALLVGSGTLIAERYATILDPPQQARRVGRGLEPRPLMATISRGLDPRLAAVPLLGEPGQRIHVYTESPGEASSRGAQVVTHRLPPGTLSARACLRHLFAEFGVRVVAAEGGPTLLRELVAERLLDDLVLTVAPLLVAGEGLSVLHGPVFDPPVPLRLQDVLRAEDHLFLRYVPDR